jgi:omega-amidase
MSKSTVADQDQGVLLTEIGYNTGCGGFSGDTTLLGSAQMEIIVALAQMEIATDHPDRNEATARSLAAQAAAQGADLLVLPELWLTGYDLERAIDCAAPLDAGPFALMARLAQRHRLYVLGTSLESNPKGAPFNTATLYGPDGNLVGSYHKVHLFPPMGETECMTAGDLSPTFDLPWGRTALAICYDLRFPELWRCYANAGAQLVLIPAEWPVRRVEHWRLLLQARAVENQFFVAGCNRAGADRDGVFAGHSVVVDPWGRVLVEGGMEPGLLVTSLDLAKVARTRKLFPFLDDRRPDVYAK